MCFAICSRCESNIEMEQDCHTFDGLPVCKGCCDYAEHLRIWECKEGKELYDTFYAQTPGMIR